MKLERLENKLAACLPFLVVLGSAAFALLASIKAGGLYPLSGSQSYAEIAANLVEGGRFETAYRPPAYPVMLALLMKLLGNNWGAGAFLLQALMGLVSAFCLIKIARQLVPTALCLLLTISLFYLHLPLQLEILTLRETSMFICLLCIFIAVAAANTDKLHSKYILLGIIAALAHLTRPTGVLLVPILALLPFLESELPIKSKLHTGVLGLLIFFSAVLPWHLTAYSLTGKISPTSSSSSGLNLLKGNNPHFDALFPVVEIDDYEQYLRAIEPSIDFTEQSVNTRLKKQAFANIKERPERFFIRALKKAVFFLSPVPLPLAAAEIGIDSNGNLIVESVQYRNSALLGMQALFSVVALLGVLAFVRFLPARVFSPPMITITSFGIMLTMVHALTFPESRFRYPLDTLLCCIAGAGLSCLVRRTLPRE